MDRIHIALFPTATRTSTRSFAQSSCRGVRAPAFREAWGGHCRRTATNSCTGCSAPTRPTRCCSRATRCRRRCARSTGSRCAGGGSRGLERRRLQHVELHIQVSGCLLRRRVGRAGPRSAALRHDALSFTHCTLFSRSPVAGSEGRGLASAWSPPAGRGTCAQRRARTTRFLLTASGAGGRVCGDRGWNRFHTRNVLDLKTRHVRVGFVRGVSLVRRGSV